MQKKIELRLISKSKLLIISFIIAIGLVLAPTYANSIIGTQKASAADPRGDWNTQYHQTRKYTYDYCVYIAYRSGAWCLEYKYITYHSSASHNATSRWFKWKYYYVGKNYQTYRCVLTTYVNSKGVYYYNQMNDCVIVHEA